MRTARDHLGPAASAWGRRFRTFTLAVLGIGALVALACSSDEKKAGLVVALQTDMSIPKDVDTVELQVSVFGKVKHSRKYAVGADGVHIPATLTLLPPDDAKAPVTIRVISYRKDVAHTLRRVVTTVPSDREALLRMPIEWLCWNQVEDSENGPVSTCAEGSSCSAGSCVADDVDSSSLPDFAATFLFGGATSDAEGTCFDTTPCFARYEKVSDTALDLGQCTLETSQLTGSIGAGGASMTVDAEKLNFGFVTSNGRGICSGDECIVPLDNDEAGWHVAGSKVQFTKGVCQQLEAEGGADALVLSTLCDAKQSQTPACGPWTGVSGSKITVDLSELPPVTGSGGSASGGTTSSGGSATGGAGTGGTGTISEDPNRCSAAQPISATTTYDTSTSTFNHTDYSGTGACAWSGLEGLEKTYAVEVPAKTGIVSGVSGPVDVLIASKTCEDVSDCYIARSPLAITQLRYFNDSSSDETLYLTVDSTEAGGHKGTLGLAELTPVCGDKQLTTYDNYSEGCDDGGLVSGDGCSSTCVVEPGYVCRVPGQACELIVCGDGIVDAPETCDDNNTIDLDGCNQDCHVTPTFFCKNSPSECQVVPAGSVASSAIYLEGQLTESMADKFGPGGPGDPGAPFVFFYGVKAETDDIKLRIKPTFSGTMWVYDKDSCTEMDCDPAGMLDAVGLAADTMNGWAIGGAAYSPQYVVKIAADAPTSGDVVINAYVPTCSDGYIDPEFSEQCDDGELVPNDGCSVNCQIDSGWSCSGEPSSCTMP